MPQLKLPDSLYSLGLSATRKLLVNAANTIHLTHGNYDSAECQQAVAQLNQSLTSSIPCHVLDDLYNCVEILDPDARRQLCRVYLLESKCRFDQRINLSICIHQNMRTLTAHRFLNYEFWESTLVSLQNLSRLDLNEVCTDEILEVVGRNCVNLQWIDISHTNVLPTRRNSCIVLLLSGVGLGFLSNCRQLKEIKMTCEPYFSHRDRGEGYVFNENIKKLLLSLPKLRRINYFDTGALFDSLELRDERLSLVSITDWHPCASRIPRFDLLCPHLTELHLKLDFRTNHRVSSELFSALRNSGLRISVLSLTDFPFNASLQLYLEVKGCYLVSFNCISIYKLSVCELLNLLGRVCNNLENLYMDFKFKGTANLVNHNSLRGNASRMELPFSKLRNLTVKGDNDLESYHNILPVLLKNATSIETIVIDCYSYLSSPWCLDYVMQDIMCTNTFGKLETLSFFRGAVFSFQFLTNFISMCPELKNVSIYCESPAYAESVKQLYRELLLNNYDVSINII